MLNLDGRKHTNRVDRAVNLSMFGIWLQSHNLFRQVLIKEYLSRGNRVIAHDRAVFANHPVGMDLNVDVNCVLNVEPRENSLHLHHSICVSRPHSSKKRSVTRMQVGMCYVSDVELCEKFFEWGVRT
jgi:hypothetical protein